MRSVRLERLERVAGILFRHENANFAVIPNLLVSLVEFNKIFLFWVVGIILEGWVTELKMGVVIGTPLAIFLYTPYNKHITKWPF